MNENYDIVILTNKMEPYNYIQNEITTDQYLLIIFHTEMLFSYDSINYFYIPPHSAIIYKPHSIQAYKANGSKVLNSFIYFNADEDFFKRLLLPLNEVFVLSSEYDDKIVFQMDRLSYIVNTPYGNVKKSEIPLYFDETMKLLSDGYKESFKTTSESQLIVIMSQIRNKMYQDPTNITISKMANDVGFSETYFGIKYKELFNITPSQDRKIQIIKLVKKYLENTNYSLEYIADLCKIKSITHLINSFKDVEKITPHQYRILYTKIHLKK